METSLLVNSPLRSVVNGGQLENLNQRPRPNTTLQVSEYEPAKLAQEVTRTKN